MARKTPSRLELRKQFEAAETKKKKTADGDGATKKKKATKKKATRTKRAKAKDPQRKRLIWGVYSASMKEEGRFAYDEREKAEAMLTHLRARSKKPYFIQPIKEAITEPLPEDE